MTETKNQSPKKALVLTADQFEDLEVSYPIDRLKEENWDITIAAPTMETIHGKHGYALKPDTIIDQINPDGYDLLILPGGSAPSIVRKIQKAQDIAKSFFDKNKPVGAICHGPYTLISAGLVKGKHLTSTRYDGVPEEIREAVGLWEDKEVIVDGNLVSSRNPKDLPAFMREIINVTDNYFQSKKEKSQQTMQMNYE